jgi:predicted murein hydrolase (TIGR00659 family)
MVKIIVATILTFFIYRLTQAGYKKWAFPLLHPLLICPIIIIGAISAIHLPANHYISESKWLTHMLGPATVAFAIPIYKHFHLLKKNLGIIVISITIGSLVAIFSSFGLSLLFHLNPDFLVSVLPRSITTPIAIEVSKEIGGLPTLTTIFVIITGIVGGVFGPLELKWLAIKSPIAKGLALGMSAHGVGTTKAMEYGEQEATFSTLAMIFAAWITLLWAGSFIPALVNLAHI